MTTITEQQKIDAFNQLKGVCEQCLKQGMYQSFQDVNTVQNALQIVHTAMFDNKTSKQKSAQ